MKYGQKDIFYITFCTGKKHIIFLICSAIIDFWTCFLLNTMNYRFVYTGYWYSSSKRCYQFWLPREFRNIFTQNTVWWYLICNVNPLLIYIFNEQVNFYSHKGWSIRKIWTPWISRKFDHIFQITSICMHYVSLVSVYQFQSGNFIVIIFSFIYAGIE